MTIATQKVSRASRWTESTWLEISDHVAQTFRLSEEETVQFRASHIAKLLGAIPYLAGCDNPMRCAVSNLAVYMMSVGSAKEAFNATAGDDQDVFARLKLARYDGGDQAIIDRGMALIALNMIADYKRDVIFDVANEKHNPVASGAWDYAEVAGALIGQIEAVDCPEMDDIADVHTIVDKNWAWSSWPSWF